MLLIRWRGKSREDIVAFILISALQLKQGFGCQCIVEIVVKVERGSPQWIKYGLLRRLSATTIRYLVSETV